MNINVLKNDIIASLRCLNYLDYFSLREAAFKVMVVGILRSILNDNYKIQSEKECDKRRRVDICVENETHIYLFELKYMSLPFAQIDPKYPRSWDNMKIKLSNYQKLIQEGCGGIEFILYDNEKKNKNKCDELRLEYRPILFSKSAHFGIAITPYTNLQLTIDQLSSYNLTPEVTKIIEKYAIVGYVDNVIIKKLA